MDIASESSSGPLSLSRNATFSEALRDRERARTAVDTSPPELDYT